MKFSEYPRAYADLKDVRLHYVTAGQGMPVVLIHGIPETSYAWRHVIPLLEDKHKIIAPDLRGLGDSSRPYHGYDKKTLADDVWRLMHDHLGIKQFAVVGHDFGSPVASRLAIDHPDAVTHLALLDVGVPGDRPPGSAGGSVHVAISIFAWWGDASTALSIRLVHTWLRAEPRVWMVAGLAAKHFSTAMFLMRSLCPRMQNQNRLKIGKITEV